jgi:anti-sigma regulatory factor (Ser/Thr protein kinase)
MVSELVTNSQRHAGDAYPWASFTLWHPNTWLVLTVHDKGPDAPWSALRRSADDEGENGRGLTLVKVLAADHFGEVDFESDGNKAQPGKVARVKMLLPDVDWPMPFRDPWTGRIARR